MNNTVDNNSNSYTSRYNTHNAYKQYTDLYKPMDMKSNPSIYA